MVTGAHPILPKEGVATGLICVPGRRSPGHSPEAGHTAETARTSSPAATSPGGANFLFGDGSVHFLLENIELAIFKAIATKDSGEVADVPR